MSTMPAGGGREQLVLGVRYAAVAALLIINIVLAGLNLQKYELFPFSPEVGVESGTASLIDGG